MNGGKILVVGIGNPFDSFDSAGQLIARKIAEKLNCDLILLNTSGVDLIDAFFGYEKVIVIDSAVGLAEGEVRIFEPNMDGKKVLSHSFNVTETVKMAIELFGDRCPEIVVVGVFFECNKSDYELSLVAEKVLKLIGIQGEDG